MDEYPERGQLAGGEDGLPVARHRPAWQGPLLSPFWGLVGAWATLCGALSSNKVRWDGDDLLTLSVASLLVGLAWNGLWNLLVGSDWARLLAADDAAGPPVKPASLPFTQPRSPAGRLLGWGGWLAGWWRGIGRPVAGDALWCGLAATALTVVLALLLPARLWPLYGVLVALLVLGAIRRRHGHLSLLGQAFLHVCLAWLVGTLAFSRMSWAPLALSLSFATAGWGMLRAAAGHAASLWLVNGGQAIAGAVLLVLGQPLAAGATGLLLFSQVALEVPLRHGADPARFVRRAWPWLLLSMLVAAWALP